MGQPFPAAGTKLVHLLKAMRAMERDELVLFTDCWDVVFVRDPATMPDTFATFGADAVFSAEPHFLYVYPHKYQQWKRYPADASVGPYRFLNSGAWIGRAGHMVDMLEAINCPADWHCDQTLYNKWFIENPTGLVLDHRQQLFASTIFREGFENRDFEVEVGTFRQRRTGTDPYLVHFGGENAVCSGKVLAMLPAQLPRLPVTAKTRWDYFTNVILLTVLYGLRLPPYPCAWLLKWLLYGLAALAGLGAIWALVTLLGGAS